MQLHINPHSTTAAIYAAFTFSAVILGLSPTVIHRSHS